MGELEDAYFPVGEPAEAPGAYAEPYEEPEEDWAELADAYEEALAGQEQFAEQQWEPSPADYEPLANLTPEAQEYVGQAQWEAMGQVAHEAYERDLVDKVAELAGEYDIHSPQAIREVAAQVELEKQNAFVRYVAEGYDPGQAGRAVDELVVEGAIRQGLWWQRYRADTDRDSSLSGWRAGREEQQRQDAAAGRPPQHDVMDSPYIARLGARLAASAERQRAWDEGVMESYRRQTGQR